jgi:hypothetical protein
LIAQQYINEFGKLAKENNTVIMPSDVSNVNQMVTQAMSIYNSLNLSQKNQTNQTVVKTNAETNNKNN